MEDYKLIIKNYRLKMGLTQKELALILNVGVASIARWECGYYRPTKRIRTRINALIQADRRKYND